MIPIGDNVRARGIPFVTLTLIAINLLVFFYELGLSDTELFQLFYTWGLVPSRMVQSAQDLGWPAPSTWLPLFTSQFLHGSWTHIIGNMIFLWIFGDNVEDLMGSFRFAVFYLLAGAIGGIAQVLIAPAVELPTIGASGAIAGVLGAYLVKYPLARVTTIVPLGFLLLPVGIPAVVYLPFWFVTQAISGLASLGIAYASGGVAYWAHIAGFVTGVVLVHLFQKRPATRYE